MSNENNPFSDAADEAAKETDNALSGEETAITKLTKEQITALFPEAADQQKIQQLTTIVNSATSDNEKWTQLSDNAQKLGTVVTSLLKKIL